MKALILALLLCPSFLLSQAPPQNPPSNSPTYPSAQPRAYAKSYQPPSVEESDRPLISGKDMAWAGALAGAIGGIVSAGIGALVAYWNRGHELEKQRREIKAADDRHLRDLALKAAVEEWKQDIEAARSWQPKDMFGQDEDSRPKPEPFDFFILKKLKLIEHLGGVGLTQQQLLEGWAKMAEFYKFIRGVSGRERPEDKER